MLHLRIRTYVTQKIKYGIGFLVFVLLVFIFASGFKGSAGSARYLLSAIGQSLAAVVALSFTIPLIALQLVASKYGIKVYELYFDKYTLSFMLFAVFSTVFPFFVLSKIYEPDDAFLTPAHNIYITIALSLMVLTLFFLIIFIWHLKEKIKPKNIINAYRQEIESFISKDDLSSAYEKVNTLKGIGIAAARERDDIIFGEFLVAWVDLLMLEKATWVKNVLTNTFPDIFKIVAREDETIAKRGLDKLEVIALTATEKKEIEKAKQVVSLYPQVIRPLVNFTEVVRPSFYSLRHIGQLCISLSKSDEASEISIESIRALKDIGGYAAFVQPELAEEAIHEITNIIHQHSSIREIVEEGIQAIIGFKGFYAGDAYPLAEEFSREVKTMANNELLHVLDSISHGPSERVLKEVSKQYAVSIANLIIPHIDIQILDEASRLIIIGARFYKYENESNEVLTGIAKILNEAQAKNKAARPPPFLKESIDKANERARALKWDLPIEDFTRKYLSA